MTSELTERDWGIRAHIYAHFVEHGKPPTFEQTAARFDMPPEEARAAYHRLHHGHAIFLQPGTDRIRMANPLSAVPTPYRVYLGDRAFWANCAWDSLGIPAMLGQDARIEAAFPDPDDPIEYHVEGGQLKAGEDLLVHFPLPFCRWYDDLIHT